MLTISCLVTIYSRSFCIEIRLIVGHCKYKRKMYFKRFVFLLVKIFTVFIVKRKPVLKSEDDLREEN